MVELRLRDINDYPNYWICNFGFVISKDKKKCLKNIINPNGYLVVKLYNDKGCKMYYLHRLVALHFIENPDPTKYHIIDHKDLNTKNNHMENLRWVNWSENGYNSKNRDIKNENIITRENIYIEKQQEEEEEQNKRLCKIINEALEKKYCIGIMNQYIKEKIK